jgi:hypothetical protein
MSYVVLFRPGSYSYTKSVIGIEVVHSSIYLDKDHSPIQFRTLIVGHASRLILFDGEYHYLYNIILIKCWTSGWLSVDQFESYLDKDHRPIQTL